ncbi:MAG: methyltransferase [Clostridiales bacterium]|jgi:tRNA1Val (adenine37-N6)-methyltransferase|nr:methyltransferase [Clostridiales bacterium]
MEHNRPESASPGGLSLLKPGERLDDLKYNGLSLIQDPGLYRFTSDAVELANFVEGGAKDYAVELGAGTGVIAVLLAAKKGIRTLAVELQQPLYDQAVRNVRLNGLSALVEVVRAPMQELPAFFRAGSATVAVCNPPYRKANSGKGQASESLLRARHETDVTFREVADAAAYALKEGGRLYLVHTAERLAEVIATLKSRRLEPKLLQMLSPGRKKPPHLFLLKCVKGAREGLTVKNERPIDITV